jgi:hypothetical protein
MRHLPIPPLTEEQKERLWGRILRGGEDECWLWMGATNTPKYGKPYGVWAVPGIDGKRVNLKPHRIVYTLLVGEIPESLTLDHVHGRCTSTLCCNPAHLEPVTQGDNARRCYLSRTHCQRGHRIKQHGKSCPECKAMGKRRERARKRERFPEVIPAIAVMPPAEAREEASQ